MSDALYPDSIDLRIAIDSPDAEKVCRILIAETTGDSWPAITSWDVANKRHRGSIAPKLADPQVAHADLILWWYGDDDAITATVRNKGEWIDFSLRVYGPKRDEVSPWLTSMESLLQRLLLKGLAIWRGSVSRAGGGVECIPSLEVVGAASWIVITHAEALEAAFALPGKLAVIGDWEWKRFGPHWMFTRALDAESNVEMLSAILDRQWAMVRIANPGTVKYGEGIPEPEEETIFHAGGPALVDEHHEPETNVLRYTYAARGEQHVRGWEIYRLKQVLEEHALPDGRRIERIEVTFPDERSMMDERRPLLDVGVVVLYRDANGNEIPFSDYVDEDD